jgi:acyl-CoA thioesterase
MGYFEEIKIKGRKANPFFMLMGIDVDSFGQGEAELSMMVRPDMLNGVGWLQGGLYAALCDEAMALALYSVLEEGERIVTISETTSFLQGVRDGRILSSARVIRKGRQVAFTEGWVKTAEDALLSQTEASFMVISKR